ncbi:MAG: glycosyltransferase [Bacteroidales bacterium]|nr:glycosyltransferase [Bacteroidales bacterium]
MKQFVSVIVPTFNRFELFLECIKSLAKQEYNKNDYEVICIHDGLKCNYNEAKIKEFAKPIKYFKFEKVSHRGVALVRNYAISRSSGQLILMIDDDCKAESDWVSSFVKYMNNQKMTVGAGGTVLSTPPQTFVQKYITFKNLLRKPVRDTDNNIVSLITANSCFRRSILDKVNGFRKEFSHYGGEDLDLSFRCRKIGKLGYCENAVLYHNHRTSLKDMVKQHIYYGRGTFLACKLNDIDFRLLKFYNPTFWNLFLYSGYVFKRIFTVSLPEFKKKKLKLSLYIPYIFLDIIRKMSFIIGANIEYRKNKLEIT